MRNNEIMLWKAVKLVSDMPTILIYLLCECEWNSRQTKMKTKWSNKMERPNRFNHVLSKISTK